MKKVYQTLAYVFLVLGMGIAPLWAVVEFILYLVKDKPFNWLSLCATPFSLVVSLVFFAFAIYSDTRR